MFQLHRTFSALILLWISVNFYLISVKAGLLQESIMGKFNAFQSFFFKINNFSSALTPMLIFTFIYATISIIFTHLAIEKKKASLSSIICSAFLPILIFSSGYLLVLSDFVDQENLLKNQNVENLFLFSNYTFKDLKQMGILFWGAFYLILIVEIKLKYSMTYLTSVFINVLPSLMLWLMGALL